MFASSHFVGAIAPQLSQRILQLLACRPGRQVLAEMRAREREEDVIDECDRRGGAFDVEDDRANSLLAERKRHAPADSDGKYAGPKQTG